MGKTTANLNKQLKNTRDINQYLESNEESFKERNLMEYLNNLLFQKNLTKAEVIRRANIDKRYGYDIFSKGKKPSRNYILSLCFGFELTTDEANHLLNCASLCELYPRVRRDSIISYALDTHKTLIECNLLLDDAKESAID